jgi:hypothetical protein
VAQTVVAGRSSNEYTVEDVVKLVGISFLAAMAKIDMMEDKITPGKIILSLRLIFPLRQFCTNYFYLIVHNNFNKGDCQWYQR